MRPIVLVAAIASASVFGGVIGGGLVSLLTRDTSRMRRDPLPMAWWCVDQGNCQRTKADCEANGRCAPTRIAYCPIGTHTAAGAMFAFCYSALDLCERNVERHQKEMDLAAHCVGVE